MVTRTDFYLGTGPAAQWLGSLQFACHPDNLLKEPHGRAALTARQPSAYRTAVKDLLLMWAVGGRRTSHGTGGRGTGIPATATTGSSPTSTPPHT